MGSHPGHGVRTRVGAAHSGFGHPTDITSEQRYTCCEREKHGNGGELWHEGRNTDRQKGRKKERKIDRKRERKDRKRERKRERKRKKNTERKK
jgi:hypothetical protein